MDNEIFVVKTSLSQSIEISQKAVLSSVYGLEMLSVIHIPCSDDLLLTAKIARIQPMEQHKVETKEGYI